MLAPIVFINGISNTLAKTIMLSGSSFSSVPAIITVTINIILTAGGEGLAQELEYPCEDSHAIWEKY